MRHRTNPQTMNHMELSQVDHATREDANAGQVIGTAKLVTPFSAALAASFLVASLQIGKPTMLDYVGAWTMVPVLLITIGIVSMKKATSNPKYFPKDGSSTPDAVGAHREFLRNVRKNLNRAYWVHWAMILQVVLSCAVSTMAVIEIFGWLTRHPPG